MSTKRFERTPIKYKHITKRDLAVVEFVYLARYVTKDQVRDALFTPTTDSSCKRRLRLLFVRGYLRKRLRGSTQPDIYYLGLRGRRHIASLGRPLELVDKVAGVAGTGLHDLFLEHDLCISGLLVSLHTQSKRWGMTYEWRNTRATKEYLQGFKAEPDAWFSIERNGKTKEAFVEVTLALPSAEEMDRKLRLYEELPSATVLWLTTSLAKANWIRRKVASSPMAPNVLVGLLEDKAEFLTAQMWWHAEAGERVSWVRMASVPSVARGVEVSLPLTPVPTVYPRVSLPFLEETTQL